MVDAPDDSIETQTLLRKLITRNRDMHLEYETKLVQDSGSNPFVPAIFGDVA